MNLPASFQYAPKGGLLRNCALFILGALALMLLFMFVLAIQQHTIHIQNTALVPTSHAVPVTLIIPTLHISADIEPVGLTTDGNIAAPRGPKHVGWFSGGPRPGEPGIALLDGHSGYVRGTPAVFDKLYALRKGDTLYVVDSDSHTHNFVVRSLKNYAPSDETSEIFNAHDNDAHLNLITCSGDWDALTKKHATRLVVFTDRLTQ